jgi:hypothetical protein
MNNNYTFRTEEKANVYTCACLELRNYLVVAPEYVGIKFFHNFQASQLIGKGVSGSTTTPFGKFSPETSVYWKDEPDKKLATYAAGDPIRYSIKELLDITQTDIDAAMDRQFASLREAVAATPPDGETRDQPAPKRRVTGLLVNMELIYDVKSATSSWEGSNVAKADLLISVTDSFTSWNPDVQMHERQLFDKTTGNYTRVYSELLNRGIMVQFSAKGRVLRFDWNVLYVNLIALLILLPIVNKLIILIAKMFSPKKVIFLLLRIINQYQKVSVASVDSELDPYDIRLTLTYHLHFPHLDPIHKEFYKKGLLEDLDYDREMSKFAASSALVMAQYKIWDKDGDGLSVEEMAERLARNPTRVQHRQKDGTINVGNLEDPKKESFGETPLGETPDYQVSGLPKCS